MSSYHTDTSHITSSMLRCFMRSRREFEARYITRTIRGEETDAMRLGSLAHAMLLEPDSLKSYTVATAAVLASDGSRRGKRWDEFKAACDDSGVIVVNDREWDAAEQMVASVKRRCGQWFENVGEPEQEIRWLDENSGLMCKAKPDYLVRSTAVHFCLDLKTTSDVSPRAFRSSVRKYRYDIQAAHYISGVQEWDGEGVRFLFVVVQATPPYQCRVYELPTLEAVPDWKAVDLNNAFVQRSKALEDLAECFESGDWSDPGENDITVLTEDCQ